jgi:hypothetical protein
MWQDGGDETTPPSRGAPWKASLQSPLTTELLVFSSLDDLFDFLKHRIGIASSVDDV